MLDSIENDNKTISQMYKGDELVWEMPEVMMGDVNLNPGFTSIVFNTYPSRCNVVVTVNKKEVANRQSSPTGLFSCLVDPPLKKGDHVVIEITKSGWGDLTDFYSVY